MYCLNKAYQFHFKTKHLRQLRMKPQVFRVLKLLLNNINVTDLQNKNCIFKKDTQLTTANKTGNINLSTTLETCVTLIPYVPGGLPHISPLQCLFF